MKNIYTLSMCPHRLLSAIEPDVLRVRTPQARMKDPDLPWNGVRTGTLHERGHLIMLAKDDKGYKALCRLLTRQTVS